MIHALLTRVVDDTSVICSDIAREILGPPEPEKKAPAEPSPAPTGLQSQSQSQSQGMDPDAAKLDARRTKTERTTGKAEVQ